MIGWIFVSVVLGADAKYQIADAACMEASLVMVLPEDGQEDVPLDARFIALLEDNGCGGGGVLEWFLTEGDDLDPSQMGSAMSSHATLRASLEPDEDLAPETSYSLVVRDMLGNELSTEFLSGVDLAPEVSGPPSGTVSSATFEELDRSGEGTWTAVVDVDFEGFSSGLSVVRVHDVSSPSAVIAEVLAIPEGSQELELAWFGAEADEVCVYFVQEDEAGRGSERSEEVCTEEVERIGGCSTLGAAGLATWWLALVPLWRRRD